MNFKKVLVVIAAVTPLILVAATCANPQYALTSIEAVDHARADQGLPQLQWSVNGYEFDRANCTAYLNAGGGNCDIIPLPDSNPYECVLTGRLPADSAPSEPTWSEERHLPSGFYPGPPYPTPTPFAPSPGGCLDEPLFKHAAIAAYTGDDGYIYEAIWLSQ